MNFTVERETPREHAARPRLTFEQFVEMYPLNNASAAETADEYARGFFLHTRCPDGLGCFGAEAEGASWCEPYEWHRLYYERRKAAGCGAYLV